MQMEWICVEVFVCLIGNEPSLLTHTHSHILCNSLHVLLACQLHCPLFLHITPPLTPSVFQFVPHLYAFLSFSIFVSPSLSVAHTVLYTITFVITHLIPSATLLPKPTWERKKEQQSTSVTLCPV